ncbi:Na+/H+ antiporter subunit E [Nesterenkonia sp. HG001]|uniref:Na+/H+ antiporter subunit E n=1 Tax=Nesterenkonia sp. HG001 TaxID=2983207 RepID=UPI002AC5100F|nr:Na+/H+ antiporter subunit E [Nesterenkonia sp. HG001]MDZ5076221.1 Na+/H+ antiporter subunit E [Nesterenkonia sp. HG001]
MSLENLARRPWPLRIMSFLFWYVREFVLANGQVTVEVLRPRRRMRMAPAIVAIPAASRTDTEWTMISTLITLTPGTLTITLSKEHGILYVHGMFVEGRESFVAEIQEMEDRLLHAMRRDVGDLTRPVQAPVVAPVEVDEDEAGDPL